MTPLTFGEWTDYDCCEPDFEAFERWNVARESLQAGFLFSDAFEYDEVLPHKALQPIQLVLDALAVAPTPVKKLQVCAIPAHFWMGGDEAGIHESNLMRQKEKEFLSLQSLDIRLIMSRRNNGLARFPQHCANVTHLNLRLYAGSSINPEAGSFCVRSLWDGYPLGEISEIFKQLRLGHLQTLVVDRFSIAEAAFVTFMKSHTETLGSITFKIPYMIEPVQQATGVSSWENAIREVAPLMSLKHADLGELQDSALSILFRKDSDLDGFYCPDIRDGKIRRFSASVAAYLLSGGQAHYPKYELFERKSTGEGTYYSRPFDTEVYVLAFDRIGVSSALTHHTTEISQNADLVMIHHSSSDIHPSWAQIQGSEQSDVEEITPILPEHGIGRFQRSAILVNRCRAD
ncbi:hypothetical protein G7Y79_00042g078610 [Physcia stellaris]|nr:hypothetical protein G7Y79_00042g078610 [Physcia stellaris]